MGELPRNPSTSATAVAGAEQRSNIRANYKSLTWEYTFQLDFYWIILQMTWQNARPKTAMKMMGKYAQFFDPDETYTYSPVTPAVESEFNKYRKIQLYDQTIGRLAGFSKTVPEVIPIIAHMIQRQLELQGDEYQDIAGMIEKLSKAKPQPEPGEGGGGGGEQPKNMRNLPVSNQTGTPQTEMEMGTRGQWNLTK
jgi:hypothetical protein